MRKRSRVVWNEGLLLTPQHLQQADRYHDETAAELFGAARPFGYGLTALELDGSAIENGKIILRRAAGVLPRGVPFSIDDRDERPASRDVEPHFPASADHLEVYLGLRVHRPGERQIANSEGETGLTRYREAALKAVDETAGESEREIAVSHHVVCILFSDENLDDYDYLPLAEVVRKPEGGFEYRSDYIAPCLAIAGSESLLHSLSRVHQRLTTKSKELSDRRRQSGKEIAEFGRDDVASLWQLATVNGYVPQLAHLLRSRNAHPEVAYTTLIRLAGELITMSEKDLSSISSYEHDRPEVTFRSLEQLILELLGAAVARHYVRIDLTQGDDDTYVGVVGDERLLGPEATLYLGVYAALPTSEIQSDLPKKIKIASPDRIEFLIANALMGVPVRHVQAVPAALPVVSGFVYFEIEKKGDVWPLVSEFGSIALYLPQEFTEVHLELIALRG